MLGMILKKTEDTTRRPQLEAQMMAEFPDVFKHGLQIHINSTGHNNIRYYEVVYTIPEVYDRLYVTIADSSNVSVEWLRDQLQNAELLFETWVGTDSYGDREMINERYGFTSHTSKK